jgi:hypothetical protein
MGLKELDMKNFIVALAAMGLILFVAIPAATITLQSPDTNYISGTVQYPSMKPIPSVWVVLLQNNVEKGRSLTRDDGSYYVQRLDNGAYDLVVIGKEVLYSGKVNLPENSRYNIIIKSTR